jgi:hypothetical protein
MAEMLRGLWETPDVGAALSSAAEAFLNFKCASPFPAKQT